MVRRLAWFVLFPLACVVLLGAVPDLGRAQGVPGVDPNKCLAGKNKCVSKEVKGLLKCRAKCQQAPNKCGAVQTACEDKVRAKFDGGGDPTRGCFAKREAKQNPANPASICTTTGDTASMGARAEALVGDVVATLEGSPPMCGAFPATGQTTCYDTAGTVIACAGTGQDGDVRAGAPLAFQDNGDGTITDFNTLLMWEKKSDDGTLHDMDNCYPWAGTCSGDGTTRCTRDADCTGVGGTCDTGDCQSSPPNGLTIFEWVDALNAASFAGYTDWRVPNVRELVSLLDYGTSHPAVSAAFHTGCTPGCAVTACSCTQSSLYMSSSSSADAPFAVWLTEFTIGNVYAVSKSSAQVFVRAVRGGV